jgi:hypothetical protein
VNLGQARSRLSNRGFQYLDPQTLNDMLNNAKNALEDEWPWPWLITTQTGTAPLIISDLRYVISVQDQNGRDLCFIDERHVDLTQTGLADSWWLDGVETLRVSPADAASELTVRYARFTPDLTNDSDTPLIPARYHPVWVDYAAVEAYKDQPNYNTANALLAEIRSRRLPAMIEAYEWRNRTVTPTYIIEAVGEDL